MLQRETVSFSIFLRAVVFIALLLLSLIVLPSLSLLVGTFLTPVPAIFLFVYWPLFLLCPSCFKQVEIGELNFIYSGAEMSLTIISWLLIAILFGMATRNIKKRVAMIIAIPAIVVLTLVVNYRVLLGGYSVTLDGP